MTNRYIITLNRWNYWCCIIDEPQTNKWENNQRCFRGEVSIENRHLFHLSSTIPSELDSVDRIIGKLDRIVDKF